MPERSGIVVRPMRTDEGRLFLEMHARSVHGLAAAYYPREVLDAWTVPATDEQVRVFAVNADNEVRLIAEMDGVPVGLGALVVEHGELRACYVVPEAARRGVGSALVREIERLALAEGLDHLSLLASLNAEPFYASLGYQSAGRTELLMRGQPMTAVQMTKALRSP